MLTLTSPVETPLHRLPAGAKLAALAVFTIALFQLSSPLPLALTALALALLHLTWGQRFARHALRMLRPIWPFLLVLVLWHLWTEDLAAGLVLILRMTIAVAAANLVTMTTRLSDMLSVFEWLARPLSPILPPKRLAMAFALVIRFIPTLAERVSLLGQAYRARSARRPGWRLAVPATIAALDAADQAAEALRARGGAD